MVRVRICLWASDTASSRAHQAFGVPPILATSAIVLCSETQTLEHSPLFFVRIVNLFTPTKPIFEILVVSVSLRRLF